MPGTTHPRSDPPSLGDEAGADPDARLFDRAGRHAIATVATAVVPGVYALLVAGFEHLEVYDACLKGRLRAR